MYRIIYEIYVSKEKDIKNIKLRKKNSRALRESFTQGFWGAFRLREGARSFCKTFKRPRVFLVSSVGTWR